MSKKLLIGKMGEEISARYLKKKDYRIISRNYYSNFGELDLVCVKDDTIVFVEVKTRKNEDYGYANQSVNCKKQSRIRKTAVKFINSNDLYNFKYRFDVVECYWQTKKIYHIENAF